MKKKAIDDQVQPVVRFSIDQSKIEEAYRDLSTLNVKLRHMEEINLSTLVISSLRIFNILLSKT